MVFGSFGVEAMKKSVRLGSGKKEQEKLAPKKLTIDRRTFLKVSALSGAAVGAGKILGPLDTHSAQPLPAKNPGLRKKNGW